MEGVECAGRQIDFHTQTVSKTRDGPYEQAAANSLRTAERVYRETVKDYDKVRKKPINRFPAFILGYGPVNSGGGP